MEKFDRLYPFFERAISRIIMLMIAAVTVYAIVAAGFELLEDFKLGAKFIEVELFQDTFGSILTVLILLEFNHSIFGSIREERGVIQAKSIVLIAIIVIARKLILLDYKTATIEQVAAYGGIALALGALFWLLSYVRRGSKIADE